MPLEKRANGVYRVRETFGHLGRIQKSLRVRTQKAAKRRLRHLRDLRDRGRWRVLRAFVEGRVSIAEIDKRKSREEIPELEEELKQAENKTELGSAIRATLQAKEVDVSASTLERYSEGLEHFLRFSGHNRPAGELLTENKLAELAEWLQEERDVEETRIEATLQVLRNFREFAEERAPETGLETARDLFLEASEEEYSNCEQTTRRRALERLQLFAGRDVAVDEVLTKSTIQKFKRWRLKQNAAQETVNNDLTAVSVLARYAAEEAQDWIEERPDIQYYSSRTRISYLEPDELTSYFEALRPRFRPLMHLLVGTGIRLGEAEALRWRDMKKGNDGTRLLVEDNKATNDIRTVILPSTLAQRLDAHRRQQGARPDDPMFDLARRTVQKEHERVREAVDAIDDGYRIHDHRHTAAVMLARAGMPIPVIQKRLGHQNIETTMKYAEFHPKYRDVQPYLDQVEEHLPTEL